MRSPLSSRLVLDRWLIGAGAVVLVLLAALVLNVVNTRRQHEIARLVAHTNELLDAIADTRTRLLLLASADQTFLLTTTDSDLQRLLPITRQAVDSGRRAADLGQDDPREQERLPSFLDRLQLLSQHYVGAVGRESSGGVPSVRDRLLSGYGPRLIGELDQQLADMDEVARELLAQRAAAAESAYRAALSTGVTTGLSSMALVLGVVVLLRRHASKSQSDAAALRVLSEELREADRRKDQFLATLAHELRNPLAPVRTAAGILASPNIDPAKLAWCRDVITRQVTHMAVLLEDLLDISRITRGKLELRRGHVSLAAVVDVALEAARPVMERKHHALKVEMPTQVPVVAVDQVRMSQALTNLLTNAAKYTDPNGQIVLRASHSGTGVVVSVMDNGVGLQPDEIEQIFGMFAQVEGQDRRSEGGLGIGLALTRGLVELHGGTISARSEGPGTGSEFIISLPDVVVGYDEPSTLPQRDGSAPAAMHRTHRILVADESHDAAAALGMILEMAGHRVYVVDCGQDALTAAARERPDVAFLDLGMPDVDGYLLARELRASAHGRTMALVALAGWEQSEDKDKSMEAGFDVHLTKPVDPETVEALLNRPLAELTRVRSKIQDLTVSK